MPRLQGFSKTHYNYDKNSQRVTMDDKAVTASPKTLLLYMALAYLFSMAIRMIWVYQFQDNPQSLWNGQLMINTNDGYYFASGAKKYLEGALAYNPRVPELFHTAAVALSGLCAKYLPFSLDSVILYLPAFISSLVVVPIILIGRLLGAPFVGFLAALIGSVAWSYYNRTMVGYFDTDMFSAMAPMFILYFLLAALETEKIRYALFAALAVLVYPFLYDQGRAIVYAMGLLYMGYMLLFHRRDDFTYYSILLIAVGLLNLQWVAQLAAILVLYFMIRRNLLNVHIAKYAAFAGIVSFLYFGNVFHLIWYKIMLYFERGVETEGLKFYQVSQTVREAGIIPFDVMANRISGSVPGVIAALVGYGILVLRHRPMILALPLIGIGIFSLVGGLRFTVYAVPVAALSAVYLFSIISSYLGNRLLRNALLVGLSGWMLYPNITHIIGYKVPTVFSHSEVELLERLSETGSEKDYVITWWDYGYPIWYYGEKNTLIDGGKHHHDNFIVSEILTTDSPLEAARLSRIAVETYVESNYSIVADTLFKNGKPDQLDVNAYLEKLKFGDVTLPEATRDVYLYLPLRMLDIFPTVSVFSNLDLLSGQSYARPFFYMTMQFRDGPGVLDLGRGVALEKSSGMVRIGQNEVPLKAFYTARLMKDGGINVEQRLVNMGGKVSLIYMPSYGRFLLVDDRMLASTYVQMFVFGKYDETLFEPVVEAPMVRVYRLKL